MILIIVDVNTKGEKKNVLWKELQLSSLLVL